MAYFFFERNPMIQMHMLFIYGTPIKYLSDVLLFGTIESFEWMLLQLKQNWKNIYIRDFASYCYRHKYYEVIQFLESFLFYNLQYPKKE